MLTFCDRLGMIDTDTIVHPEFLVEGRRHTLAPSPKLVRHLWGVRGTLHKIKVDTKAWHVMMRRAGGMEQKPPAEYKWVLTFDEKVGNMTALQNITKEMLFG